VYPSSILGQASIATPQTDQTGAVIQPMTVAALTVAATMAAATATRALRFTKNRMLSNIIKLPPDPRTAPQIAPFIKVYEGLIADW
jgi:hypothetical protein